MLKGNRNIRIQHIKVLTSTHEYTRYVLVPYFRVRVTLSNVWGWKIGDCALASARGYFFSANP